jgi:hypothetical protein
MSAGLARREDLSALAVGHVCQSEERDALLETHRTVARLELPAPGEVRPGWFAGVDILDGLPTIRRRVAQLVRALP